MNLHPEIAAHLQAMKDAGFPALNALAPDVLQDILHAAPSPDAPDMARVVDYSIDVEGGQIPLRAYFPEGSPRAITAFLHGGGWTLGSILQADANCRFIAANTNTVVVSIGYRLAPEHKFPTAVNDAYAALEWIDANRSELSVEETLPLIVQGDSAGANLTAVMCILARDKSGPKIAAQIMTGPATDGEIDSEALTAFVPPFLSLEETAYFYDLYIPDRDARRDFRFAPINADSHADLPPALIITADADILRAQGEAYGQTLSAAGVPTMVVRVPGTVHSFMALNSEFELSRVGYAVLDKFITGFVAA